MINYLLKLKNLCLNILTKRVSLIILIINDFLEKMLDSFIFIYTLFLFISRQYLNKISSLNLSETTKSLFSNDSCIDKIINSDKK